MAESTKDIMTMHEALHLRDDKDRLYGPRKGERRELAGIEENVDTAIRGLENFIKKSKERLITAASNWAV